MTSPQFNSERFFAALTTRAIGRRLEWRPSVDTTMVLARQLAAAGCPHGTAALAEEQTAGRGRRGRSFTSPPSENLYVTFVLRFAPGEGRALALAVPLAVCEAVRAEGVDARIKWPNDIWVGERKLSGMLIDAESDGGQLVAYPGIGINVNGDPTADPALRDIATSLRRETGRVIDREQLLARLCAELETLLEGTPADVVERYRERSMVLGRAITVTPYPGEPFAAVARAIADDGTLIVETGGELRAVHAADVSVRPA